MSERASFRDVCEERRDNHFPSCSLLFRAAMYNLGKTPQLAVPKGRYQCFYIGKRQIWKKEKEKNLQILSQSIRASLCLGV